MLKDLRQFGIRHILLMTLTFGIAMAVWRFHSVGGFALLIIATAIWAGFGLLFVADSLDPRPIDQRNHFLQALNLIGILLISIGFNFFLIGVVSIVVVVVYNTWF